MLPLLALLLAADPAVHVQGEPARAHIQGETDTFFWIEAHDELRLTAAGPGRLVLDLRGWARHPEPSVAPVFSVTVDGAPVPVPPIRKPANMKVEAPGGFASTSTLLPLRLKAGTHLVRIREARGSPGLVSTTFIPEDTDFFPMPRRKPRPEVAEAPAEAPPVVRAAPEPPPTPEEAGQGPGWALELQAGGGTQLQLGGLGPMIGLAAEAELGASRSVAVGVGFDYLRVPLEVVQPLPQADAVVTGAATSMPLLVRASWRPVPGEVAPFVGVGAGVTFASVALGGAQARQLLPAAEVRAGVDIAAGPGQVVVQARVLAAQGDFTGVAEHFQAGGAALQAGYRLAL